jgi:hypothetical protein
MAKDGSGVMVLASPFKFGFFAGLGFFFASALMSVLSVVFVAAVGLGTLGSLIVGSAAATRATPSEAPASEALPSVADAAPAAAVLTPQPTYHRKPRTYGDE